MRHNLTHGNCSPQRATSQRQRNEQETDDGLWGLSGCDAATIPVLSVFSTH